MLLSRHKDGGHAVLHSHSPPLHPLVAVSEGTVPSRRSYLKDGDEAITALCALLPDGTEAHRSFTLPPVENSLRLVSVPGHEEMRKPRDVY